MGEGTTPAQLVAGRWRPIDDLAALVGAYSWVEGRLFALAGTWATEPVRGEGTVTPEERVFCAVLSRRHGAWAARWAERLPVRAGVDAAALVGAPSAALEEAFGALGAGSPPVAFAALVSSVLPRLRTVYVAHLAEARAVSEGPVMEVLGQAAHDLGREIRQGRALLQPVVGAGDQLDPLVLRCERAFDETDVFPAVRPS